MTLEEFSQVFARIRSLGFVPSKRKGATGVGYTLERLLNLSENNIALSDLSEAELKAHRIGSSSMITLFTFNRKAWKMNPLEAIRKYGTPDENGRLGLYFTMSPTPNSAGLFLHFVSDAAQVRHISGTLIAEWKIDEVARQFERKIPKMILVSAFSEMRGETEWFHYVRAQLLSGTSANILEQQIKEGNVLIDLRLHDAGTRARNHGTGFRAKEEKLPMLFREVREI
ncbi:MAG: MvaI/BcnI family restriction endonuclease [Chloroherpetonaceae bacterium]|nr:MvaI/BcnI family restriction endonuclease [Chloroherpetonaceae bacterium]